MPVRRIVKTRIIATVGPASESEQALRDLILSGADIFRLNFAHGTHEWLSEVLGRIRSLSEELRVPVGVLGDLSGPKIRLGEIQGGQLHCPEWAEIRFVRGESQQHTDLTCTYDRLIDDVRSGDRILLADGTVTLQVTSRDESGDAVTCRVVESGVIRSRQGVNLPGVQLSTPAITAKDEADLDWALTNEVDFIGLSFVRQASDISHLRKLIRRHSSGNRPMVVAKIEKTEAVADLENILDLTDAVMVARGDLGVEAEITRVPILQKDIIRRCNRRRIPVITATQMLDSMQQNDLPTRAEVSDVANAVIDGTDAVMLSGETAVGVNPSHVVRIMDRIAAEAEPLVTASTGPQPDVDEERQARPVTEAVAAGAVVTAAAIKADLIAVPTKTGRTALALSRLRCGVPVIAVTGDMQIARRMSLYWGVTALPAESGLNSGDAMVRQVVSWGTEQGLLRKGSRIVIVGRTDWLGEAHNLMMVHVVDDSEPGTE